jgi:sigma-E factor negative regulatory protein RseA
MNKETLEHISSMMDGELSRDAGLFLTRRLSADKELTDTWERYHLIRDCMRHPGAISPDMDLSDRMKEALTDEVTEQPSWSSNRWLKPVSGIAIAASVALMAIVAIGPEQSVQSPQGAVAQDVQPFSSPNVLPIIPNTQAASFSPASQNRNARLNSYLVRHNQASGSITTQGFLGFVPLVSSPEADLAAVEETVEQTGVEASAEAETVEVSNETDPGSN